MEACTFESCRHRDQMSPIVHEQSIANANQAQHSLTRIYSAEQRRGRPFDACHDPFCDRRAHAMRCVSTDSSPLHAHFDSKDMSTGINARVLGSIMRARFLRLSTPSRPCESLTPNSCAERHSPDTRPVSISPTSAQMQDRDSVTGTPSGPDSGTLLACLSSDPWRLYSSPPIHPEGIFATFRASHL